jgi:hypothetical protein
LVFADSPIHHDWRAPVIQVLGPERGRFHRGQEGKRSLLRVASALVVDVVEDETIETQRGQALLGHVGDLLGPLRREGESRGRQCEEQKLAPPCRDPLRQVHGSKLTDRYSRLINSRACHDLWDEFMTELRAEHLGAPLPAGTGPTTIECLAAAHAVALGLETGQNRGNDDIARPTLTVGPKLVEAYRTGEGTA